MYLHMYTTDLIYHFTAICTMVENVWRIFFGKSFFFFFLNKGISFKVHAMQLQETNFFIFSKNDETASVQTYPFAMLLTSTIDTYFWQLQKNLSRVTRCISKRKSQNGTPSFFCQNLVTKLDFSLHIVVPEFYLGYPWIFLYVRSYLNTTRMEKIRPI
jgi:hypothetical protein